jgi:addiction module HigA family antidote
MKMHNPPKPGEFILETYIEPFEISVRKVAQKLAVSPSTLNRLINCECRVSPEMALRLSKTLGRSPESWLAMQSNYDLWQARKNSNLRSVEKLDFQTIA